jgi:hypothetical protein
LMVGCSVELCKEDWKEMALQLVDSWQLAVEGIDKNSARAAVTRGPERGKQKNSSLLEAVSRERLKNLFLRKLRRFQKSEYKKFSFPQIRTVSNSRREVLHFYRCFCSFIVWTWGKRTHNSIQV